ncbi:hypothetical protein [Sorangium sp. So ce1078]|uniref:hypothetical protein n=1 Tax=Sorangium sp. So ce1078 TaxID=3133329 RepID=UPI003F60CF34
MGRTSSALALALMSLAPLCTTIACGPVVAADDEDDPTNPEQASACEPRQAEISADFELIVEDLEDWPRDGFDAYRYNIAAPCQVEAANAASRDLSCTDKDGAVHRLTLAILNPDIISAVPASGPVFVRTARYTDFAPVDDQEWFEVRAGSDVTGALLVGGARAAHPTPFAPAEGYFAPIEIALTTEEGCPEEFPDECLISRRSRLSFWVDETPGASILDGHQGVIGASGTYRAIVGASVANVSGGSLSCAGDDPRYHDELRFLIGARALNVP